MTDRSQARLATDKPKVCVEQPSFGSELLAGLAVLLLFAWISAAADINVVVGERDQAREMAAYWKRLALEPPTPDANPSVHLVTLDGGFRCQNFNVRREWEAVVAAQCKQLAETLHVARARP